MCDIREQLITPLCPSFLYGNASFCAQVRTRMDRSHPPSCTPTGWNVNAPLPAFCFHFWPPFIWSKLSFYCITGLQASFSESVHLHALCQLIHQYVLINLNHYRFWTGTSLHFTYKNKQSKVVVRGNKIKCIKHESVYISVIVCVYVRKSTCTSNKSTWLTACQSEYLAVSTDLCGGQYEE